MNKKWFRGILIAAAILFFGVSPASAIPPLDVHIEVYEFIATSGEPFDASGPAVDAGLLCATGTVADINFESSGPPNGDFRNLRILKRFTCDGTSGTFDVSMRVRLDLNTGDTTARWRLFGGTGAYAGLHGSGSLIGIPDVPGTILDIYDGKVH